MADLNLRENDHKRANSKMVVRISTGMFSRDGSRREIGSGSGSELGTCNWLIEHGTRIRIKVM